MGYETKVTPLDDLVREAFDLYWLTPHLGEGFSFDEAVGMAIVSKALTYEKLMVGLAQDLAALPVVDIDMETSDPEKLFARLSLVVGQALLFIDPSIKDSMYGKDHLIEAPPQSMPVDQIDTTAA